MTTKVSQTRFVRTPAGPKGSKGWSPVFATIFDGARAVRRLERWVGGDGTMPPTLGEGGARLFESATGLTTVLADATNVRGAVGEVGSQGETGQSAYELAVANGYSGSAEEYALLPIAAADQINDALAGSQAQIDASIAESQAQIGEVISESQVQIAAAVTSAEQAASGADQAAAAAAAKAVEVEALITEAEAILEEVPNLGVTAVVLVVGAPAGSPVGALPNNRMYTLVNDANGKVVLSAQGLPVLAADAVYGAFTYVVDAAPIDGGQVLRWAVSVKVMQPIPAALFDAPLTINNTLPQGALIANLTNPVIGETLTVSPNDGRLQFNGARLELGPSAMASGKATFTVRRAMPDAWNPVTETQITVYAGNLDYGLGVIFGASIEAAQHSASGSSSTNAALQTDGRAHILLANALSGGHLSFPEAWPRSERTPTLFSNLRGANMAMGGKTLRSIEPMVLRAGVQTKAGHVFVSPGRNGIPQITLLEHQTRYMSMCAALRAQGRVIWHLGLFMRVAWAPGDGSWTANAALDQWMRAYAAEHGERYVDLREAVHNGSNEYYGVDASLFPDGTHPGSVGGWLLAQKMKGEFNAYFGGTWPDISAKLLDAANKVTNPYMTGTGGSKANGATGVVPDGYWLQGAVGGTCAVASEIVVGPDGRNRVKITVTPPGIPGANESILFRCNPNKFGVAGSYFEFLAGLVKSENSNALVKVNTRMQLGAAPDARTTFFEKLSADAKNHNGPFEMRMGGNCIEYISASGGTSTTVGLDIAVDPGGTEPVVVYTTGWGFLLNNLRQNYPADVLLTDNLD